MSRPDDETPRGGAGPDVDPARFPALEDFLLGYLHEDFEVEFGSPDAAADAFFADAGPEDHLLLLREWQALQAEVGPLDEAHRLDVLTRLGAAWQPRSWSEVEAVFDRLQRLFEE